MVLSNFIVFEGIDGSGTSTQIKEMQKLLVGKLAHFTCEPTSNETGKFLRKILKGEIKVDERTATFLFAADRCEHLYGANGIVERCEKGEIVISDRYFFSSLAYQSATCGEELPCLVNSAFPLPEILFYFDIKPEISLARVASRDGFETEIYENIEYQTKTATQYRRVIEKYKSIEAQSTESKKMRIIEIDATEPIKIVTSKLWSVIKNLPIINV